MTYTKADFWKTSKFVTLRGKLCVPCDLSVDSMFISVVEY